MNHAIDMIVLLLFLYYLWRGWKKGFLGSILGPISLLAGCLLSYSYYQKTQNILIALSISLFGPIFFHITAAIFLKMWAVASDRKKTLSVASRLFGAAFSLSWSGGMLVLLILLVMVIPSAVPYAGKLRDHLSGTQTYMLISHYSNQRPLQMDDPKQMERLSETKEYKQVMQDDRFRKLVMDPEVQKYIGDKDFGGLMNDENVKGALQDRDLMLQLFEFQKRIIQDSMESDETQILKSRNKKTN